MGPISLRECRGPRPSEGPPKFCNDCNRRFTVKGRSVFEDSPIGLDKWMPAIRLISNDHNGISSCYLFCAVGITQPIAQLARNRIRAILANKTFDFFQGIVEADKTNVRVSYSSKRPLLGKRLPLEALTERDLTWILKPGRKGAALTQRRAVRSVTPRDRSPKT